MVTRRELLAAGTGSVIVGAGGCLEEVSPSRTSEENSLPVWCPDEDADYRCGEGDPIEVDATFDDDDEVVYHENGTVDVVTASSGDELRWENREFETWAGYTCPSEGAREAIDRTYERLEPDREEALERGVTSGIGSGPWSDDEIAAFFRVYTGDEGEIADLMSPEAVVAAAPTYAETTLTLADREHECTVPVYVETYDELAVPGADG